MKQRRALRYFRYLCFMVILPGVISWSTRGNTWIRGRLGNSVRNSAGATTVLTEAPVESSAVLVRCPETNRVVECFWDWSVRVAAGDKELSIVGHKEYLVLHPCDQAVALCRVDDSGELEPIVLAISL